jgi:hypothetical protein
LNQTRAQKGPVHIDFIGNGYIHPDRFGKLLREILRSSAWLAEGITVDGFTDGSQASIRSENGIVKVRLESLKNRYEMLSNRLMSGILAKLKQQPQALVLSGKTLGIDIVRNESGQIVIHAQSADFRKFYEEASQQKLESGQNIIKLAIPVVLPKGISHEEISSEQILRALWTDQFERMKQEFQDNVLVEIFVSEDGAVLEKRLGQSVKEVVKSKFFEGVPVEPAITFVVAQEEQELYGDLAQYLYWIVEGTLDAKKLLLIAEGLASEGIIQDQELLDFLKNADPDSIAELNKRRLTNPKTMLEELELQFKTERQTATMA